MSNYEYDPARSSFKNWLFPVTRNRIIDYGRRRRKQAPSVHGPAADWTGTSSVARLADPHSARFEAVLDEEWRRNQQERGSG